MKVWKGTDGMTAPEERECEKFGWPNRDSAGEEMFRNTHFRTEAEAWESIRASVEAGVSLSGHRVNDAREQLRRIEQQAADAASEYATAMDGYRRFQRDTAEAPASEVDLG